MLLRNVRPDKGNVNGTRYVVLDIMENILFLKSISGNYQREHIALPRTKCLPGNEDFPVPGFQRRQFPVRVCFAMTINKSQGQSIHGKLGLTRTVVCRVIKNYSPSQCICYDF